MTRHFIPKNTIWFLLSICHYVIADKIELYYIVGWEISVGIVCTNKSNRNTLKISKIIYKDQSSRNKSKIGSVAFNKMLTLLPKTSKAKTSVQLMENRRKFKTISNQLSKISINLTLVECPSWSKASRPNWRIWSGWPVSTISLEISEIILKDNSVRNKKKLTKR